jgi:hypothetical protein
MSSEPAKKKNRKSVLVWGASTNDDWSTQCFEESTWISSYRYRSGNEVEVFVKSGSKEYALPAQTDDHKLKLSPLQLKKKYR